MVTSNGAGFRVFLVGSLALGAGIGNSQNAAQAAAKDGTRSVTVRISDLDITTQQGAATAYARIRNAAREVCGPVDIALPDERAFWDHCVSESIINAAAKVDSPSFTAYCLTRTQRRRVAAGGEIAKAVPGR